jgi:RecB family endonuclease NucS
LKLNRTGKSAIDQVKRYLDWLHKRLSKEDVVKIRVFLCAPSFSVTKKDIPKEYDEQIKLISLVNKDQSIFK